jgi:signal transduction histidine kinase
LLFVVISNPRRGRQVSGDETEGVSDFPDVPQLELDQLIDQLVERAHGVRRAQGRIRQLLRAVQYVSSDLSLETVLHRVVEAACDLVGARYGALGVIGHDDGLERFIQVGIDDGTAADIGDLPEGKGLLGALISEGRPIRLRELSDDERSSGFPANHPPMRSFLGVPVRVRGQVFGVLYLADSVRGEFSAEDEDLVGALAVAAATAVSNARLYQQSRQEHRWLEASAEVQRELLTVAGEDPLHTIARRARDISDADLVCVTLLTGDRETLVVESAVGDGAEEMRGRRFPLTQEVARVFADGEPLLTIAGDNGFWPIAHLASAIEAGPIIVVPLQSHDTTRGALTLVRHRGRQAFTPEDVQMAARFARHADVALELADTRRADQQMLMLEERDRIARDLHDHVIQELFSVGMGLHSVAAQLGNHPAQGERVLQHVENLDQVIRRIRTSIFALREPPESADGGLRSRILQVTSDLVPALGFPPAVSFAGLVDTAVAPELADDVIACIREGLANVARHARATSASVDVRVANNQVTITVTDNGVGIPAEPGRNSGLGNLATRARNRGGELRIRPRSGCGTVLEWTIPIDQGDPSRSD